MKALCSSIVFFSLFSSVAGTAEDSPDVIAVLKAMYPGEEIVLDDRKDYFFIGESLSVRNSDYWLKWCEIASDAESKVFFVVLQTIPARAAIQSSDLWNARLACAVIRWTPGEQKATNMGGRVFNDIAAEDGGNFTLRGLRSIKIHDMTMALLEYRHWDGISTPRGTHTITKLLAFGTNYEPEETWSLETEYSYGGSSQPHKSKKVRYSIRDINGDGQLEIETETTTYEEDYFEWDGAVFKRPRGYPVEPKRRKLVE